MPGRPWPDPVRPQDRVNTPQGDGMVLEVTRWNNKPRWVRVELDNGETVSVSPTNVIPLGVASVR